jgi:hypothetical protein
LCQQNGVDGVLLDSTGAAVITDCTSNSQFGGAGFHVVDSISIGIYDCSADDNQIGFSAQSIANTGIFPGVPFPTLEPIQSTRDITIKNCTAFNNYHLSVFDSALGFYAINVDSICIVDCTAKGHRQLEGTSHPNVSGAGFYMTGLNNISLVRGCSAMDNSTGFIECAGFNQFYSNVACYNLQNYHLLDLNAAAVGPNTAMPFQNVDCTAAEQCSGNVACS